MEILPRDLKNSQQADRSLFLLALQLYTSLAVRVVVAAVAVAHQLIHLRRQHVVVAVALGNQYSVYPYPLHLVQ
ncbi:hypothetical protein GCM10011328_06190 [Hafnia psychrotolerans]|uniref:Uncharacterized protein n=1 Tax=Hafnia psychrotolerans TaxID=1477018 RepID=A0ABQ1FYR7_9GAMM|nr:hypothetical protein GCM10011328_06190 [Hafnia psychrotolerans]